MNDSVVVMSEGLRKCDSVASTSQFGSLVQINSIAIELCTSMEVIEPPKHEHFTIRGFVAGLRKKNKKACLPFASESNDVDMIDHLPPLSVPRFQWWQCADCIADDETKRATEEMEVETTSLAGTDSCQNVGDKNGLFLPWKETTAGCVSKTDVRDKEGNSCHDKPEANPLQIIATVNNTTDIASDIARVTDERPSCVVEKPDNASPGSDGTSNALPHKRKPKLRSLADIMMKESNQNSDNPRTRSTSSCGTQVTSTEMEAVLSPQPELHVPTDLVEDPTAPERKRKIDVREDGGPLKVIYPSASGKRIKGLMVNTEKNDRGAEVFDSESEGDASMRLDLRVRARTQRIKLKKTKDPNISKKMRQIHKDDNSAPLRKCSADLQKHAVPLEINIGKLGCAPASMGETGPCSKNSHSGKKKEKTCNISKSKTPEIGGDHGPVVPPGKSNLGDCNVKENVALDLSLNSFMDVERDSNSRAQQRVIPDLNEEPLEKIVMAQGQQLTTFPQKGSLPLHGPLDFSPSCTNDRDSEGKREVGFSESGNKEQSKELGASDDIPMEIVELLAKIQRERALGINSSTRGYSAHCADVRPINRTSGLTVGSGNMGVRQNIPMNFPQLNNYRWDMGRTEERLLWSSTRESVPFPPNIAPKHTTQRNNTHVGLFSNQRNKGKTVTDMKDGNERRAIHNTSAIKEGRNMGAVSTSLSSLDPYSNNTIPAMQLLSLMDQRVVRTSSYEVGAKSFLEKSLSSCNHRVKQPFLTQNRHYGSRYNVHCSGESSKKVPSSLRVTSKAIVLATSEPALGVCSLNRNPAEFSIPDAGNEFTLSAKDLRRRNYSKGKPGRMVSVDGRQRRERTRKDASGVLTK